MRIKDENIYWGEISVYKSILAAIIISALTIIIDQKNIPSEFICKYGMEETIIGIIFIALIISICFGRRHISDLLKMPCGNAGDEAFIICIISCICVGFCEEILELLVCYKLIALIAILSISIVIIISRYCFCRIRKSRVKNVKSGMDPKTLQYLMGHADIGVTLNTYTHVNFEDAKAEVARLSKAI